METFVKDGASLLDWSLGKWQGKITLASSPNVTPPVSPWGVWHWPLTKLPPPEYLLWAVDSLLFLCGEPTLGRGFKCERPLLLCQEEFRAWGACSILACHPPKKQKTQGRASCGPMGAGMGQAQGDTCSVDPPLPVLARQLGDAPGHLWLPGDGTSCRLAP